MNCDTDPKLMPLPEAILRMQRAITAVQDEEVCPLANSLDRVLSGPVTAGFDVPGYDNSAMDGYALCSRANQRVFTQVGEALAGHAFKGELSPGECVRIMTGAKLPIGADTVVMQENTITEGDLVTITQASQQGDNIRRAGEDITRGSEVLPAGKRLGPVDIALLASMGLASVPVKRRLKVAVLSTGDELTPPGEPLKEGHIYDSNRYGIVAMLQRLNVEVQDLGLIPDSPEAIRSALERASQSADAIISSGGVSVGDADYVKDVLEELGDINFWKVAIKPGKPFAFGTLGSGVFFGLPGNPVSAMVTLHQLALPILRLMAGEQLEPGLTLNAIAQGDYKKKPGRQDFQRATLSLVDGQSCISSNGPQGSGVLTSFRGANAYAVLERESGRVKAGDTVTAIPFDRFIS